MRPRDIRLGDLPRDLSLQRGASGTMASGAVVVSAGTLNDVTVAGSKPVVASRQDRQSLEFQNQSLTIDMRLNWGMAATVGTGLIVPAGGTRIWDVKVPVNGLHVFCAVAGEPYCVSEGVPVPFSAAIDAER